MALMVCSTTSFMVMQGIIPEAFCGLLSMIGMIGMTIYLVSMPVTPHNQDKRMAVFMGVAALMGACADYSARSYKSQVDLRVFLWCRNDDGTFAGGGGAYQSRLDLHGSHDNSHHLHLLHPGFLVERKPASVHLSRR